MKRKSEYKNKSEGLLFILCIEHLVKMTQKNEQLILYIFLKLWSSPNK